MRSDAALIALGGVAARPCRPPASFALQAGTVSVGAAVSARACRCPARFVRDRSCFGWLEPAAGPAALSARLLPPLGGLVYEHVSIRCHSPRRFVGRAARCRASLARPPRRSRRRRCRCHRCRATIAASTGDCVQPGGPLDVDQIAADPPCAAWLSAIVHVDESPGARARARPASPTRRRRCG